MHRKLYKTLRKLLTSKRNAVIIIIVVLFVFHFFPKTKTKHHLDLDDEVVEREKRVKVPDTLTVIVREYEDFDNRLYKTLHPVTSAGIPAIVMGDNIPYPPVKLPKDTEVLTVNTSPGEQAWMFQDHIHSTHVAIIPDGCCVSKIDSVLYMISRLNEEGPDVKVIAAPCTVRTNNTKESATAGHQCQGLTVDLRKWTLTYYDSTDYCDSLSGPHVLVMATKDVLSFPYPFVRPVQDAIFIQCALRKWKVVVFDRDHIVLDSSLYKDPHKHWKHKFRTTERLKHLYKAFGIKLVHSADGKEEYHGCTRESARCFGTIVNSMPEYLYQHKWTPPCCLKALRATGRYVFNLLENQGVRFWLEGGSLLGAARNGDVIPWDYDIDLGIYQQDIEKSVHLSMCAKRGNFIDDDGYVWEKSKPPEPEFYRIQYSEANHMHVDIFPFYSKNGVMTKDTWMKGHKQDTEFPEHYLKPLTTIDFIGVQAPAPNNWKQFLVDKFGPGVIENPKYPDETMEVV